MDCGYSFPVKLFFFYNQKHLCILHGRVFVMYFQCNVPQTCGIYTLSLYFACYSTIFLKDLAQFSQIYEGDSKSSRKSAVKFVIVMENLRSLCIL